MLSFSAAAASHVGTVRHHNEDSGFAGPGLLVVADGVGGHAAGEVASATATYVVTASALADPVADPVLALPRALELAQRQVALGAQAPGRQGMATTLTAVLGDGERFALLHLGDSRAYLFRAGRLERLSRDHTVVQELLDAGSLRPEQARGHRWGHLVTRSLAGDVHESGELVPLTLHRGDRLLLSSDGLTDLVDEADIAALLRDQVIDAVAVEELVGLALAAGGRDNVTCVVATVVPWAPQRWDGQLVGAARDPRLVVDPAAVRMPSTA
jgi:serine/threonine protein phosphatase PrpC